MKRMISYSTWMEKKVGKKEKKKKDDLPVPHLIIFCVHD